MVFQQNCKAVQRVDYFFWLNFMKPLRELFKSSFYVKILGGDIIQQMTNNSIWFQSPFPKPSAFFNPHSLRPQPDHQQEDSCLMKSIYYSPEPIPIPFKPFNAQNPLSPWSELINPAPSLKYEHCGVEGLISEEDKMHEEIDQKLVYSDNQDQDPVTPLKNQHSCKQEAQVGWLHTTGRKSELEPSFKRSRPRQKGLRKLSQRAFEIVQQIRTGTYKEVATRLVQQLNEEQLEAQNKEEQNIKRRVYDALNVLIALGVLKKDGRRIISQRAKKGRKPESIEPEQTQALRDKVTLKMHAVEEKRRKLAEVQCKFKSITNLLQRNKSSSSANEANIPNIPNVPFPFIAVCISSTDAKKVKKGKKDEFLLKSTNPFDIYGDIDSLKWLNASMDNMVIQQQPSQEDFCQLKAEEIC